MTRAPAAAAAALAVGLLSGCGSGFDATSIEPYAPSDGILADSGDIRVLNALVVSGSAGTTGVVSASIANRGGTRDRLTDVTTPDGTVDFTGDATLRPGSVIRLSNDTTASATISGLTKLAGETITLRLEFRRADPVTLRTVVVAADGDYASITAAPTPAE